MNPRILIVVGAIVVVALLAAVPLAFVLGRRGHAPPAAAQPVAAAPAPAPAAPPPAPEPAPRAPVARAQEEAPAAPAPADKPHKGGLLGGLLSSAVDDVKASGQQLADQVTNEGKQAVSGAVDGVTKAVDARIDAAAKDIERRSTDVLSAIDGDLAKGGQRNERLADAQQDSAKSSSEAMTKQQEQLAASMQALAADFRKQLAAATADLSARVTAYNDALKQSVATTVTAARGVRNLLQSDAKSLASNFDVDKEAAAVRAAIDGFGKKAAELQHACEDGLAKIGKEADIERDHLRAQIEADRKDAQKRIDDLRKQLDEEIAKAADDAKRPLDEAQARLKTAHSSR